MPSGPGKFYRVAIVGASSLLGKELKQVLEDRNFPSSDIVLLDESVMAGTLAEAGGEPTFFRALDEDSFEGAQFACFAGSAGDAERNWSAAQKSGATVIDMTGALPARAETAASAISWIPSLTTTLPPEHGRTGNGAEARGMYCSPSAPVIITCTLAAALKAFETQRISVLLFPPVSERGQEGIEELETQTASLLSFREIAKSVFDAQVAFNLLARYGEGSATTLGRVRSAVARDVARYVGGRAPVPAIQMVQAPVFYGYAFAAFAEMASPIAPAQLEVAFAGLGAKIAAPDDMPPTNVSVAGKSEIQLARIETDPNVASGVWIWGVADNLRLAATNAVRIAEEVIARSTE
ncbi:MAG TPA: Asd/ArgC dimerization domain-containing protein [Candidatus Acidoferrales bacterium]|nr:Asd/ArgC dimerization domain-containing protein [Candidatus Acidoferrales bacterium]